MKRIIDNIRTHINWIAFAILAVSLVPILYCSLFNYASADEFSKSSGIHNVILAGGNLFDILAAGVYAAYDQWATIEGTWSSNFFLSMQPSLLGEHAYAITVPLCILYAAVGSGYLFYEIFVTRMQMTKRAFWFLFWGQLFLFLQYMPYIRGGMFWYVGMAHYIMPMCAALLMIAWMLKWFRTGRKRYYVYMLLVAIYMGGSHYQHILIVLVAFLTGWILEVLRLHLEQRSTTSDAADTANAQATTNAADGFVLGNKVHLLWIPMVIVLAGLYLCVISPGNVVRGEGTFGMNPTAILLMPLSCTIEATRHAGEYLAHAPLIIVYAILLWAIGQNCIPAIQSASGVQCASAQSSTSGQWSATGQSGSILRRFPAILIAVYLYLLYATTEAPAIYAKDNPEGISGAYYDTVYHALILAMTVAIPIVASRVQRFRLSWKVTVVLSLVLTVLFCKAAVRNSSAYICYDFVQSGQLEDFRIQMEERLALLNDPALEDVVVPEMNNEQGPYMHLQLSQDPSNYTNRATCAFYNKHSVTAVPRDVYYAEYAAAQGHEIPEAYRAQYGQ